MAQREEKVAPNLLLTIKPQQMSVGQRRVGLQPPDFASGNVQTPTLPRSWLRRSLLNVEAGREPNEIHTRYGSHLMDTKIPTQVLQPSNLPSVDDQSRNYLRLGAATTIAATLRPDVVLARTAGTSTGATLLVGDFVSRSFSVGAVAKTGNDSLSVREPLAHRSLVSQNSPSMVSRSVPLGGILVAAQSSVPPLSLLMRRETIGQGISLTTGASPLSHSAVQSFTAHLSGGGGPLTQLAMVNGGSSIPPVWDEAARSSQIISTSRIHEGTGAFQTWRDASTTKNTAPAGLLRPLVSRPQIGAFSEQVLSRLSSDAFSSLAMTRRQDDRFMRTMDMVSQTTPTLGVLFGEVGPSVWNQHGTVGQRFTYVQPSATPYGTVGQHFAYMQRSVAPFASDTITEAVPDLPLVQTVRTESSENHGSVPQIDRVPAVTSAISPEVTPPSLLQAEAITSGATGDANITSSQSQIDLEEVVEKVWQKLMFKVTIEQERRGNARWA